MRSTVMKVMTLTHTASPGGAELGLARLLGTDMYESVVVLGEDGPLNRILREKGIRVEVRELPVLGRRLRREQWRSLRIFVAVFEFVLYAVRLQGLIRKERPDVLHLNTIKAAVYGLVAGKLSGVPCVWHVRDGIRYPYLSKVVASIFQRLSRCFDGVIANSSWTASGLSNSKLKVIYGLLESDRAQSVYPRTVSAESTFNLCLVGRISPWKDQLTALKALKLLDDATVNLRIVGSPLFGEQLYLEELVDYVATHDLGSQVEFLGFVEDVSSQYEWADLVLHTSNLPEPFGLVIIEAMSHGRPVIATSLGGPGEIIEAGKNGLLFEAGDYSRLAELISELRGDYSKWIRLSDGALWRSLDFRPSVIRSEFLEFLEDVVGGGS